MRPSFWVLVMLLWYGGIVWWLDATGQGVPDTTVIAVTMVSCTYFICSAIERLK